MKLNTRIDIWAIGSTVAPYNHFRRSINRHRMTTLNSFNDRKGKVFETLCAI